MEWELVKRKQEKGAIGEKSAVREGSKKNIAIAGILYWLKGMGTGRKAENVWTLCVYS